MVIGLAAVCVTVVWALWVVAKRLLSWMGPALDPCEVNGHVWDRPTEIGWMKCCRCGVETVVLGEK